jgi:predicted AAA+ superfamily ATPase
MYPRSLNIPLKESFFLFGARGTGKSTFLKNQFQVDLANCPDAYIDLLSSAVEREFTRNPDALINRVLALKDLTSVIIIDEIQKVPKLLDVVHALIENHKVPVQFALTGSSARKLKAGSANLLAGRAFVRNLYPLSSTELAGDFDLVRALTLGTLPKIFSNLSSFDAEEYLESYANTYLNQEVLAEQLVRKLEPFRFFLEIAAAQNSSILNFSAIARDAGTDAKTVHNYYSILEDTLLGFLLPSFESSVRKRMRRAPKFYFFDGGVARSLSNQLRVPLNEGSSYFGLQFEAFVLNEIYRRNEYSRAKWKLAYLQTEAGVEVDLVLHAVTRPVIFVEIKSATQIREDHLKSLKIMEKDFPESLFYCLSRDPSQKAFGNIKALPWQMGIEEIFGG